MKLYMLDEFKWLKRLTNVSFVSLHATRVQFPHGQISITLILSLWANQSFNSFVMHDKKKKDWQISREVLRLGTVNTVNTGTWASFQTINHSQTDEVKVRHTLMQCSSTVCIFFLLLFSSISKYLGYLTALCMCVWVCMLVCGCTPLPTGLGDHIPADMPFRSLVTSAGVSRWQGLFVCVLICSEETWADRQRRQEEGSHNKFPPSRHKMSSFPWLQCAPSHPAEKSRHLKLCDMCHRHCHWASATDGAGIDRPRATGAGWGTHRVWCVSAPILVRDASRAATQTQAVLWDGWSVVAGWHMLDMHLSACEG